MTEVSNGILAGLLILAIVVSLFGIASITTISRYIPQPKQPLAGAATGTGKVNLSITSGVAITLLRNESLFGSGYPNSQGGGMVYIATNKSDNCGTLGPTQCFYNGSEGNGSTWDYGTGTHVYPFVVRVDGNDPSTCIRLESSAAAASFIGGSGPSFKFGGKNNETNATTGATSCWGTLTTVWTEVPDTVAGWATVCDTANHTDINDEIRIHWQLGIPEDAEGSKAATITVCGAGDCISC